MPDTCEGRNKCIAEKSHGEIETEQRIRVKWRRNRCATKIIIGEKAVSEDSEWKERNKEMKRIKERRS